MAMKQMRFALGLWTGALNTSQSPSTQQLRLGAVATTLLIHELILFQLLIFMDTSINNGSSPLLEFQ